VTDRITIDGVIRSDNRGSESIFPLFLYGDDDPSLPARVNFSDDFQRAAGRILPNVPGRRVPERRAGGPCSLARLSLRPVLFAHLSQRYADLLRADFPRVFLTSNASLWDDLADLGCRLMAVHLGPGGRSESLLGESRADTTPDDVELVGAGPADVAPAHPKFSDGTVWINRDLGFYEVPDEIWQYRGGGHQVCASGCRIGEAGD